MNTINKILVNMCNNAPNQVITMNQLLKYCAAINITQGNIFINSECAKNILFGTLTNEVNTNEN